VNEQETLQKEGKNVKSSFMSTIALFAFVRLILSMLIICVFIFGLGPMIEGTALRVAAISAFSVAICSITAIMIARYVKEFNEKLVRNILESVKLLTEASLSMSAAAKGMGKNAGLMKEFADVLDEMGKKDNDE